MQNLNIILQKFVHMICKKSTKYLKNCILLITFIKIEFYTCFAEINNWLVFHYYKITDF